ncbi:MAG: flagellar hook protein FlgE [Motiliproteus sp.]|jgi:flagellar hook protein FlgE
MAFSTAITGLKASTTELDVTGNNIANASTVGFKSGRTEFADIFSTVAVGSGSANSAGSGVIVSDIAQDFTAGTIQFTNSNLDLAIDGGGFFQLNDGQGGISYTRAGGFELDKDGYVVAKNGNFLQGFGLDSSGNAQPVGNLAVSEKESPPQATELMNLSFNIDAAEEPTNLAYDPSDSSTFSFSTTSRSFDSLGNENTIKFDFIEQGPWRERQTVGFADFGPTSAGDSINVGGASFTPPAPDAAAIPAVVGVDQDTAAAAIVAEFDAKTLQAQSGWDVNIATMAAVGGELVVTYKASAADTRPILISLDEGTSTTDLVSTNTENPFFAANKIESHAFGGEVEGSNKFVTVGDVQIGVEDGMSSAQVVAEIIKSTNAILNAHPEIETLDKNEDGELIITYKPELGDEPQVAVTNGTAAGLTESTSGSGVPPGGSIAEVGDRTYEGVYQMHALFNSDTPLDIGRAPQPGSGLTTTAEGPILVAFDTSNGLLSSVNGQLVSADGTAPSLTVVGADPTNPINEIDLDLSGASQFASDSIVKASTQDGYTKGDLIGVSFGSDGTMEASFSNGQKSNLGIVALATFENQNGLQPIGDTAWTSTLDSGQAILNPPGTGLNGQLRSAALEQSNVDLSEQLVKLIEAQRNFQANSKTLQTENSITQTILQIS